MMESKKRILEFFSFAGIGGTQQMFLEYLRHASHDRYTFYVCVLLRHGFLNEEVTKMGIENTSLSMKGYWNLRAWWKLYRFARGKDIDLIRTYGLKAHIIGRLIGKMLRIPVNISSVRNTDPWRKWYHAWLDFGTSWLTDIYISNSEAGRLATHYREHIPFSKIMTIPNGIDITRYESCLAQMPDITARYKKLFALPPTAPVIGIVANLREQKGHKTIIDALPHIQNAFPEVKCFFVGEDLLNGDIQAYVRKKHIKDAIIFTGSRNDIPEILTLFDIFILPSQWEGFPKSLVEAMAMKRPVVTTKVGGIPELVIPEKTGLLIPPQAPSALSEAIISLLQNPKRATEMGENGRKHVHKHFTIQMVVKKTETIYEYYIDKKRSSL